MHRIGMLGLLLVLAACAGGQINKNESFDSSDERALVLLGVSTTHNGQRSIPLLVWSSYDRATRSLGVSWKSVSHRADEDAIDFANASMLFFADMGGNNMYAFLVPPGTYVLEQVRATRRWSTGGYYSSGVWYPTYDHKRLQNVLKDASYSFTVEAGKANYVGEISISRLDTLAVRRRPDVPDNALARLADFPEVTAELVYRPMTPASFTCGTMIEIHGKFYCPPKDDRLP